MKIVKPSARIVAFTPNLEEVIEEAGRVCYKSEEKIADGSAEPFVSKLIVSGHEAVIEHAAITVAIVCDRGVSHELVRHRIASFCQESTRYCNYAADRFSSEVTFVDPRGAFSGARWEDSGVAWVSWLDAMSTAESAYLCMIGSGASPQEARSVLPNSVKTEVVMTANPREWRHVFELRCAPAAHPQMREVMIPLRETFSRCWPSVFSAA